MDNDETFKATCPTSGCGKTSVQCVEVSAPVTLAPTAVVGTVTTTCQGNPVVVCVTNDSGTSCTVTLTQKICMSIPVQYGVRMTTSAPSIACDGDSCSCK